MPTLPMMSQPSEKPKKTKKDETTIVAETLAETESKHAETDEEKSRTVFISNLRWDSYRKSPFMQIVEITFWT